MSKNFTSYTANNYTHALKEHPLNDGLILEECPWIKLLNEGIMPANLLQERNSLADLAYRRKTVASALGYLRNDQAIASILVNNFLQEQELPSDKPVVIGYLPDGGALMARTLEKSLKQRGVVCDIVAMDFHKEWLKDERVINAGKTSKLIVCDDVISTGSQVMDLLSGLAKNEHKGEVTILSNRLLDKACIIGNQCLRDFVERNGIWDRYKYHAPPVKLYAAHMSSKPYEMVDTADCIQCVFKSLNKGEISLNPDEVEWIASMASLLKKRDLPGYNKSQGVAR